MNIRNKGLFAIVVLVLFSMGNLLFADSVNSTSKINSAVKVKIAVMDFKMVGEENPQIGLAVAENIRTSLIDSNQFEVIERSALLSKWKN